jgi:hypothetical protein
MVETFGQVWFLCAIAFLAGSGVTWLLFVRQRPRPVVHPLFRPAPPRVHHPAPAPPRPQRAAPPQPQDPAEPALADLDTHRTGSPSRHTGSIAAGALDRLGVAGGRNPDAAPDPEMPAPEIPAQGGPVDEPASGESR